MSVIDVEIIPVEEEIEIDAVADVLKGDKGDKGDQGIQGVPGYTPQKGTDYFTSTEIAEIKSDVKDDVIEEITPTLNSKANIEDIPTKTSDINNDSGFIDKEVNNLTNYELKTNTGSSIALSINSSTYAMTLQLKNSANQVLSEGTIDLPLETMVVNATYDNNTKEIVLTLQSGTTTRFSVADLVSGLVSTTDLNTVLASYYTKTEIDNLLSGKVDKVAGKGLSTEDYTSAEKEKLAELNNYDDSELVEQIEALETELEETQEELAETNLKLDRTRASLPKVSGEGEYVTLNGTSEDEFIEAPLPIGRTEQTSYTGKNLFDKDNVTIGNYLNNNGSLSSPTNDLGYSDYIKIEPNETYTIKGTHFGNTPAYCFYDSDKNFLNGTSFNLATTITFTNGSNSNYIRISFFTDSLDNIQLEKGSTATSYEPYVGGTASPNPDYPQEIKNISGEESHNLPSEYQEVEYIESTGTQYIDTGIIAKDSVDIKVDAYLNNTSDQRIVGARTSSNKYEIYISSKIIRFFYNNTDRDFNEELSTSKLYNFSIKGGIQKVNNTVLNTGTGAFNTNLNLFIFASNENGMANYYGNNIYVKVCKIYENNVLVRDFIPCYRKSDNEIGMYDLITNTFFTNAGTGTFVKGKKVGIKVTVCNKNLAKTTDFESITANRSIKSKDGYIEFETFTSGINVSFDLTGGVVTGEWEPSYSNATDYHLTPEDEGNYILKVWFDKLSGTENVNSFITVFTNLRKITRLFAPQSTFKYIEQTITLQEGEHIKQIEYWNNGSNSAIQLKFYVQLEKGATATDYVPHQQQTFTFPLSTGQKLMEGDYLADDGVHHVRGQKVLDGTEISTYNTTSNNVPYVGIMKKEVLGMKFGVFENGLALMESYTEKKGTSYDNTPSGYFNSYYDKFYIAIFDDRFTNIDIAKQLLVGEKIEYVLAKEVIEPYTKTQQEVYNNIKKAISYKDQTNIYSTNEISPTFKVTAYKDISSEIDNLKTAIVALGGVV